MKYLTKSKFKEGIKCPFRLTNDFIKEIEEDSFLSSLADGGFQAEELSRLHYPNGVLITDSDHNTSLEKTNSELNKINSTIYEAAFIYENLFIRTDILSKSKNKIKLIEVKAKSFNSRDKNILLNSHNQISSNWKPYLFDLAFQKFVVEKSNPHFKISACLMLADKSKKASIDGLNQLFQITNKNSRTGIEVKIKSIDEIGNSIMEELDITSLINDIIYKDIHKVHGLSFQELINVFSNIYSNNKNLEWSNFINHFCIDCWMSQFKISVENKLRPNIFEIWNFRNQKIYIDKNIFFLDQLHESDFNERSITHLTVQNRQWLQIESRVNQINNKDSNFYLDEKNLKSQMNSWKFPLHFIDFETCTSALPFTKGRYPYEQIAFQYSHHTINSNGKIEHKTEYINTEPGLFPNFHFIRQLKKDLQNDEGSIFKYATHENSILNSIHEQLLDSKEEDRLELMNFIESITNKKSKNKLIRKGNRDMIDMCELVKKYFYHPYMKGSNSIKTVLPTIIQISDFIRTKYSKPLHQINLTSLNFLENHVWIKDEEKDPYNSLPTPDLSQVLDPVGQIDKINNGGEALTAYAKIQYMSMSNLERNIISEALLKYCELDTLAMVMIYEFFAHNLKIHKFK